MGGALGQALILIIKSIGSLYILAVLLRFLLQAVRADFYNPVSQAIVKFTSPALVPFRRVIPGFRKFDFAALVLALTLGSLATALMIFVSGNFLPGVGLIISWAFVGLLAFLLDIYFYALVISIVASFIAPFSGNPVLLVVQQILEPVYTPIRRILPSMGGLDFSPILIFLLIRVLEIFVTYLAVRVSLSPGYVIGYW